MLPLPSSSSRRPRTYFPSLPSNHNLSASQQALQVLRSRTRLTNLAVTLLLLALTVSLVLNASYLLDTEAGRSNLSSSSSFGYGRGKVKHPSSSGHSNSGWDDSASPGQIDSGIPLSIETTIERDGRYEDLDHLIMVPGHAIWLGHEADRVRENDDWVLEPMQKGGSVKTYVKHIERGVEELEKDPRALLVFSGGATRLPPSPPLPEALSYHNLAHALSLLPSTPIPFTPGAGVGEGQSRAPLPLNLRAATEEFALDSYENLLFSIARFKEVSGRYPGNITVVGYGMKRRRFTNLHRAALNYPLSSFHYIGIDDEGDTTAHYTGELKYGFTPFISSPSGCHPPLSIKRLTRNPYKRYHPYHTSCPELHDLLEWCPPMQTQFNDRLEEDEEGLKFDGFVPWREGKAGKAEVMWDRERD